MQNIGQIVTDMTEVSNLAQSFLRESSFNMTRGGDEDIETRSLKF